MCVKGKKVWTFLFLLTLIVEPTRSASFAPGKKVPQEWGKSGPVQSKDNFSLTKKNLIYNINLYFEQFRTYLEKGVIRQRRFWK